MSMDYDRDRLIELIWCYESFFKSPFPTMVSRGIADGQYSGKDVCARLEAALACGRADEEWEKMVPPEGSIDYLLHYKPLLKSLIGDSRES